ncbi:hypothetical protein [Deinococcus sp. Leaf326]|uniref:hypothetical protein n=1 Tax=Deinococcus sp. Leaf326 TaxID=1736338 RepID=UPI0012E2F891|nr:hypothetical protein [Deinococcus sp. Leaf326]
MNGLPEDLPASVMTLARVVSQGQVLEVNTFMVAVSPVLLSLLCTLLAMMITPSIVSEDIRGGILEALLTTPLGKARIFRAYLGAAVLLTLLCWGLCGAALSGTWALISQIFALHVQISSPLLWMLAALPLSMTFWSAAVCRHAECVPSLLGQLGHERRSQWGPGPAARPGTQHPPVSGGGDGQSVFLAAADGRPGAFHIDRILAADLDGQML